MTRWAAFLLARRWLVLIVTVTALVLGGAWGLGVFPHLRFEGFLDDGSEAAHVTHQVEEHLGRREPDIVAIYTAPPGQSIDDIGPEVAGHLAALDRTRVERVDTYWTVPVVEKPYLRSADGTRALVTVTLQHSGSGDRPPYHDLLSVLQVPGVDTQLTGKTVVDDSFNTQLKTDLVVAESVSLPLTLILLVMIFGGLTAAAVPVLVAALSVLSALGTLRLLTMFTAVNAFALNVTSLLCLGLAIDYGLFIVSRFREELRSGASPNDAVRRTVLTAGRTVCFSALLLVCAFAGMLVFPQEVIRSLGLGAISAALSAALLSLTAVPAALAVLGARINSLTWRRGAVERGEVRAHRFWGAVADRVMRHPLRVAVPITLVLVVFAAPVLLTRFGSISYTSLPPGNPVRAATEQLVQEFRSPGGDITVLVHGTAGSPPPLHASLGFVAQADAVDGVTGAQPIATTSDFTVISAAVTDRSDVERANAAVAALRELAPPAGTRIEVGGPFALEADNNHAITEALPTMIAVMVGATLLLLFLAFGTVVLPVKAVAMAGLSLGATFGLLTWIFQEGHGAGLIGVAPEPVQPTLVVLILAVVFGLSTDYEIFLMSRMVEAHAAGASTETAVHTGTALTGRVVTCAALILGTVTAAFALSPMTIMRFIGLGMIFALVIDATLVRMLLVPSLIKLMGDANWWAPAPLARLHRRIMHGWSEGRGPRHRATAGGRSTPAAGRHRSSVDLRRPRRKGSSPDRGAAAIDPVHRPHRGGLDDPAPSGEDPLADTTDGHSPTSPAPADGSR